MPTSAGKAAKAWTLATAESPAAGTPTKAGISATGSSASAVTLPIARLPDCHHHRKYTRIDGVGGV